MSQETTTNHDWQEAGEAWGDRATDWAYLWEPYARSANRAVFDQLAVADGTRLLDIACGSGFAAHLALDPGFGLPQPVRGREDSVGVAGDQVLVDMLVVPAGAEQVADQVRHVVAADDLPDHGNVPDCGPAGGSLLCPTPARHWSPIPGIGR